MTPEYYPDYDQRKRTLVMIGIITTVIITLVIICYVVFAFFFRMGKVKVEVVYAPHYAEVELNGKKVKNPLTRYLEPGEYEVRVWAAEFEEFSTKVQVDENTKYIYGSLNPATAKGEELINGDLQQQFLEIEGIAGQLGAKDGQRILGQYPILTKLPYRNSLYTLGYLINSGERDYTLTVKTSGPSPYFADALEKLLSFADETGKALAEYRIELVDFVNPFQDQLTTSQAQDPAEFLRETLAKVPYTMVYPGNTKNDYYYTVVEMGHNDRWIGTFYRVVLRKDDGGAWKLAGLPTPIVTTENTPDVPLEILNRLNEIDTTALWNETLGG